MHGNLDYHAAVSRLFITALGSKMASFILCRYLEPHLSIGRITGGIFTKNHLCLYKRVCPRVSVTVIDNGINGATIG